MSNWVNTNIDLIKIKVGLHTVREFVLPFACGLGNRGGDRTSYVNGIHPIDMLRLQETFRQHCLVVDMTDS